MHLTDKLIKKVQSGINLSFEETKSVFLHIMSGKMSEEKIFSFLVGLSKKGETADEIAGGVFVLRKKSIKS